MYAVSMGSFVRAGGETVDESVDGTTLSVKFGVERGIVVDEDGSVCINGSILEGGGQVWHSTAVCGVMTDSCGRERCCLDSVPPDPSKFNGVSFITRFEHQNHENSGRQAQGQCLSLCDV